MFEEQAMEQECLALELRTSKLCPGLTENDYDSDTDVVKKAKAKAIRELKTGILEHVA